MTGFFSEDHWIFLAAGVGFATMARSWIKWFLELFCKSYWGSPTLPFLNLMALPHPTWKEIGEDLQVGNCCLTYMMFIRILVFHLPQPVFFIVSFAIFSSRISEPQKILGLIVAAREASYILLIIVGMYKVPTFFLGTIINVDDSVTTVGSCFCFIFHPEKMIATFIYANNNPESLAGASNLQGFYNTPSWLILIVFIVGADICGVVAFVLAMVTGELLQILPHAVSYCYSMITVIAVPTFFACDVCWDERWLDGRCCFTRPEEREKPLLSVQQQIENPAIKINRAFLKASEYLKGTCLKSGSNHIAYHAFISHVQLEAQDTCGLIAEKLQQRTLRIWFDMEVKKLDKEGMIQGVAQSNTFIIYATRSYLTRPWCCFELLVALKLKKKIQIVYETNENGFERFDHFVKSIPIYLKDMGILALEALPWHRREPLRSQVLNTLEERLKCSMPLVSWTIEELAAWVATLGTQYVQYESMFLNEEICGNDIVNKYYGEDDLIKRGVEVAHARKIIGELQRVADNQTII